MTPNEAELREELQAGPIPYLAEPLERGIAELDQLAGEFGKAGLDPALTGGAAFLWEDLLSLEDAVDAAGDSLNLMADTTAQVKLLLKLVLFWRKLRGVRIVLTREEFQVMRAVKRNPGTIAQIASQLSKGVTALGPVVDALKSRRYRDDIMLLDEDGGIISTRF